MLHYFAPIVWGIKKKFYDFSIGFRGTILRSDTFAFRPDEKQVLPAPNVSPSSRLCGIGWSIVSGRNITQKPDASATTPNITAGTFGSKLSAEIFFMFSNPIQFHKQSKST